MKAHMYINLAIAFAVLLVAGCSYQGGFNPAYLPAQPMALNVTGKGLVVLTVQEAQRSYVKKPSSFTGGGTTLTLPLGEITKQVALKVFGATFIEGVDFRNESREAVGYRVVIRPRVVNLTYAYNQLKNAGFAITPQASVELEVILQHPDGGALTVKTYESGLVDGDTYVISGQPAEKINQLVHLTLFKLMTEAAKEVKTMLDI